MAYPEYTDSEGLKTDATIKSTETDGVATKTMTIQNHSEDPLKIKIGGTATTSNWSYTLYSKGDSITIEPVPDSQEITCFSDTSDIKYSYTYR